MASGGAIGIGSTRPLHTWISASVVGQLAVLDVKTVVIEFTLQVRNTDAIRTRHEARGTDTLAAIVREHQTSAGVTDALVTDEDKAKLSGTSLTHALAVGVEMHLQTHGALGADHGPGGGLVAVSEMETMWRSDIECKISRRK